MNHRPSGELECAPRRHAILIRKSSSDADVRADIVLALLGDLIAKARTDLDIEAWHNLGWGELERFVEALIGGLRHPLLVKWQANLGRGHPGVDAGELRARRLVVLLVTALRRAGLSWRAAQRYAAREVGRARLFAVSPNAKTIEHWRDAVGAPTPPDEQLIGTALAACGYRNHDRLALYFLGLAHLVCNPSAVIVHGDNL